MEPPEATERIVHVVDDDANLLRAVARLLRSHGYAVKTYSSASEFLSAGVPAGPACLLLDLNMPGMTGLELQQVVSDYQSRLAIVFISGQGDLPAAIRAMKAGAVDFLTKPFDGDVLVAAIDNALRRSRAAHASDDALQKDWERFQRLSRQRAAGLFAFRPGPAQQADRRRNWERRKEPSRRSVAVSCESWVQIRFRMSCVLSRGFATAVACSGRTVDKDGSDRAPCQVSFRGYGLALLVRANRVRTYDT